MDIILLERIEKLGQIGDVVSVKDGYARNYLLPNKKALRANEANRKVFEANRARIEAENAARRDEAARGRPVAGGRECRRGAEGRVRGHPAPALGDLSGEEAGNKHDGARGTRAARRGDRGAAAVGKR